jgi:hypothetical protein
MHRTNTTRRLVGVIIIQPHSSKSITRCLFRSNAENYGQQQSVSLMNSNVTYVGVKSDERIKITQEENQTAA